MTQAASTCTSTRFTPHRRVGLSFLSSSSIILQRTIICIYSIVFSTIRYSDSQHRFRRGQFQINEAYFTVVLLHLTKTFDSNLPSFFYPVHPRFLRYSRTLAYFPLWIVSTRIPSNRAEHRPQLLQTCRHQTFVRSPFPFIALLPNSSTSLSA